MGESLKFAFQSIRSNLTRTLLSLMGVTIGVFCIISIFTLIDSLESSIKSAVSRFGDNVVFVQKWPWAFSRDYPWWKYMNRPEISYQDMQILQKRFTDMEAMCFTTTTQSEKLVYKNNSAEGASVMGVSYDYYKIMTLNFENGRYFTEDESQRGDKVVILGYQVARTLFNNPEEAIDQKIQMLNRKMKVVGVLAKEGQTLGFESNQDKGVIVPVNFIRSLSNVNSQQYGPTIMVKGKPREDIDKLEDELHGAMRGVRKLGPWDEDNFALNRITAFTSFLTSLFGQINLFGLIIAGFSILVGGFGIANIMFVSVKERTPIIGIQKSLGAKSYFILIQFLGESVFLCILGGIIALFLIFILSKILNQFITLELVLTMKNIILGIGISSVIGVLSGFIPSLQAARMDPIEAIRTSI
jgi:putative ABC transport system permease protein